jgi:c-di-GMP-binding flagellar brake protein YcgR
MLLTTRGFKGFVEKGTVVKVAMFCTNGVFVFNTEVIDTEDNFPYLFWYLKSPEKFEVRQQREFYRTRFNLKTTLTIIFNNGEKLLYQGNTFDISGSGASLLVSLGSENADIVELLAKSTIKNYAKIGLCLHFNERSINTKVEFVHKRLLNENKKFTVYAFKFSRISPTDSEFITKQCFSKQLQEQNKSKLEF